MRPLRLLHKRLHSSSSNKRILYSNSVSMETPLPCTNDVSHRTHLEAAWISSELPMGESIHRNASEPRVRCRRIQEDRPSSVARAVGDAEADATNSWSGSSNESSGSKPYVFLLRLLNAHSRSDRAVADEAKPLVWPRNVTKDNTKVARITMGWAKWWTQQDTSPSNDWF